MVLTVVIIAIGVALLAVPLLKSVMEGVSDRARNDAVFGFGILTLIALLIFGCVAIIAQNLKR